MNLSLGHTRVIIEECKKQGLLRNQAAYVLARCGQRLPCNISPTSARETPR